MTQDSKKEIDEKINKKIGGASQDIWQGIDVGLQQVESKNAGGRVPALMVLTGGPPQAL